MIVKHFALIPSVYFIMMVFLFVFVSSKAFSFPYKGLELKINGSIAEKYDDNIEFNSEDKKSEFITILTLDLGIQYLGKTRMLDFRSNISRERFNRNSNLNNTSGGVSLNFQYEFSKYDRAGLNNTFSRTFEPGNFEDEFGTIRERGKTSVNKFDLFYERDISKELSILVKYFNAFIKTSAGSASDFYRDGFNLRTQYNYSVATNLMLIYNFSRTKYKDTGVKFTYHTFAAGITQYITKKFYLSGKIGADYTTSIDDMNTKNEHIEAFLNNEIDENTNATLLFRKNISTTSFIEDVFDSWQISGDLKSKLSKRLDYSLKGSYGEGRYKERDIKDKLWRASIILTYLFTEHLKGNLSYIYSSRESTDIEGIGGYTRNTILSGLTLSF